MKRVFIFGYYGFKNMGDEAILASIVKTLRECYSSVEIYVLSYNVKYTERIHKVKGISRNNIKDVVNAIRKSDLVISGGGSLLQDVTSNRSLIYYLGLISMAKAFNRPVVFYSNGFGPVSKRFNRLLVRKVVNRVDKIILRDEDSKAAMESIGINRDICVTADATYILEDISKEKVYGIFEREEIPVNKPLIGISVRPWSFSQDFPDIMARFGDYIIDKGFSVVFIPMQVSKDTELSREIIKRMKNKAHVLKSEYSPRELLGIIGEMKILIGMRLHSLIFASIKGVPMLGIEYDPKVNSFLRITKQRNLGRPQNLDFDIICSEFDRLLANHRGESLKVKEIAKGLKEKIQLNKEYLFQMLK